MERKSQPADSRLNLDNVLRVLQPRASEANFFRFCQLLELAAPHQPPLGSTSRPGNDLVRFRPDPGMGFPAGELKSIEFDPDQPLRPATVRTRFLGLYGVDSPMPSAYLDDIAQRRDGHEAVEAFLDIFNHRIHTQFYRIWRKYCYPANFEAGGQDATSQCLLGLIGLGIPGTAKSIATPVSRFLALLSVMRLPTRNAEGVVALVKLLAPETEATVTAHWPRAVPMCYPASLSIERPVRLNEGTPPGPVGIDATSELLLCLFTRDQQEAHGWRPGARLYGDLLVLLRAYLGWRCTVTLHLSLLRRDLPEPQLGNPDLLLSINAALPGAAPDQVMTTYLGRYQGLKRNHQRRTIKHAAFQAP